MLGACGKSSHRCLVVGTGVCNGDSHLIVQRTNTFHRPVNFGRKVNQLEQAARSFLNTAEHFRIGTMQERCVWRPFLLL